MCGTWKFPGQGSNWSCSCQLTLQPQQCRIQATSVTYTMAHGNARSLTHCILMDTCQVCYNWAKRGTPTFYFIYCSLFSFFTNNLIQLSANFIFLKNLFIVLLISSIVFVLSIWIISALILIISFLLLTLSWVCSFHSSLNCLFEILLLFSIWFYIYKFPS